MNNKHNLALSEIFEGVRKWRLWSILASHDVKRRYRRSYFRGLWTTLSIAIFVGLLGPLYSAVMQVEPSEYIPHLVTGLIIWNFISNTILEGTRELVKAEAMLKSTRIPLPLFIFRNLWRNLIVMGYQVIVFVAIMLIFWVRPSYGWLLVPMAMLLLFMNALGLCSIACMVATRYRDATEFVQSVMRIMFFLTPIIWLPQKRIGLEHIYQYNPFYHIVGVPRDLLLHGTSDPVSWAVLTVFGVGSCAIAYILFAKYRTQIPFWV
jgi:ABC-2 type transport system permease protein/lipopolysaccharide transport system permease protein